MGSSRSGSPEESRSCCLEWNERDCVKTNVYSLLVILSPFLSLSPSLIYSTNREKVGWRKKLYVCAGFSKSRDSVQ